jgi:hypothetical protein
MKKSMKILIIAFLVLAAGCATPGKPVMALKDAAPNEIAAF